MNRKTRYFVIASLLVLGIGVGVGLVAYYVGVPTAFAQQGPDELQMVPGNALVVAYANVHEVMVSNLREHVRQALPQLPDGQREFEAATGINIESDVDRVVAALVPAEDGRVAGPRSGLIIAAGRFDQVRIESLMREHGAAEETYRGRRMFAARRGGARPLAGVRRAGPRRCRRAPRWCTAPSIAKDGGVSVRTNDDIMDARPVPRPRERLGGRPVRCPGLAGELAVECPSQLPPITWFAVSGHVNGGLLGEVRMETRDEVSANQFRDVIRGVLALGNCRRARIPSSKLSSVQYRSMGRARLSRSRSSCRRKPWISSPGVPVSSPAADARPT